MPWWVWGLLANVFIALIEYVNRVGEASTYLAALRTTLPLILIAQLGLFYCWRHAPSMMLAWAVFTLGNTVIRLASVQWAVGEPPSVQTVLGVGIMTLGAFMIRGSS